MSGSPTRRSLEALRKLGYVVQVVEHWNSHAGIRQDLFGFVDILAIRAGETLAVQTTSGDHVADRIAKIRANPRFWMAQAAGWRVEVHGWKAPTKTIRTWRQRIEDLTHEEPTCSTSR